MTTNQSVHVVVVALGALLQVGCLGSVQSDGQPLPSMSGSDPAASAGGGGGDAIGGGGGGGGGGTTADNALVPDGGVAASADMGGVVAKNCLNKATSTTSGQHNAGLSCLDCHKSGGGEAPAFTFAGTLFSAVTGGSAVAGATIEATDAKGQVIRIVTSKNGNFYTSQAVSFPLTVRASACPSDQPMIATVQNGNCNTSGCHASQFQIHLP
jgi:hypothetical protein